MFQEYPKINTIFKRDMANRGIIIEGQYSAPAIEYLAENQWEWTEKVDGTNIRVYWKRETEVAYAGRTDRANIPKPLHEWLQCIFTPERMDAAITKSDELILYGEGFGAGIQKGGGNYCQQQQFVLFDVLCGDWWLERGTVEEIGKSLNIPVVPVVGSGTLTEACKVVSDGMESSWGNFTAEGLVLRPRVELKDRGGRRIITKIKHRDFIGLKG